jgi:hypothetical protein
MNARKKESNKFRGMKKIKEARRPRELGGGAGCDS